jgi:hypothetical protein
MHPCPSGGGLLTSYALSELNLTQFRVVSGEAVLVQAGEMFLAKQKSESHCYLAIFPSWK